MVGIKVGTGGYAGPAFNCSVLGRSMKLESVGLDLAGGGKGDAGAALQPAQRLAEGRGVAGRAGDEGVHAEADDGGLGPVLRGELGDVVLDGLGVLPRGVVPRQHQREVVGLHAVRQAEHARARLRVRQEVRHVVVDKVEKRLDARRGDQLGRALSHGELDGWAAIQ